MRTLSIVGAVLILFPLLATFCPRAAHAQISITTNSPERTRYPRPDITITGSGASISGGVQMLVNDQDAVGGHGTASATGGFSLYGKPPADLVVEPFANTVKVKDETTGTTSGAVTIIYDVTQPQWTGNSPVSALQDTDGDGKPDADAGPVTFSFKFNESMSAGTNPRVVFKTSAGISKVCSTNPRWNWDSSEPPNPFEAMAPAVPVNLYTVSGMVNLSDAQGPAKISMSGAVDLAGNTSPDLVDIAEFVISLDLSPASIFPASPFFSDSLTAYPQKSGQTYGWYKNGSIIPGQTGQTLPPNFFERGDVITVAITLASGDIKTSPPVTIVTSLPSGLAVKALKGGVLELTWTASVNPLVAKTLVYTDYGTGKFNLVTPFAEVVAPSVKYLVPPLADGTSYKFVLGVADAQGRTETANPADGISAAGAVADSKAPSIKAISPEEETQVLAPKIVFQISDTASGLDLATVRLTLDGKVVPHAYNTSEGLVYFPVPLDLTPGSHSAVLTASDKVGNATTVTRFFTVKKGAGITDAAVYPNPCRGTVQILRYTLGSSPDMGTVTIYDSRERVVRKLDAPMFQGVNEVEWDLATEDGYRAANGTYFIEIKFVFDEGRVERKILKSSLVR